jgi:hypothetical protein
MKRTILATIIIVSSFVTCSQMIVYSADRFKNNEVITGYAERGSNPPLSAKNLQLELIWLQVFFFTLPHIA